MKKRLILPILVILAFVLVGCSKTKTPDTNNQTTTAKVTTKAQQTRDIDYPYEIQYKDEDALMIHYYRPNQKYSTWGIWLWGGANPGREYSFINTLFKKIKSEKMEKIIMRTKINILPYR